MDAVREWSSRILSPLRLPFRQGVEFLHNYARGVGKATGAREKNGEGRRTIAAPNVHGRFLRSDDFSMQNSAIRRNGARISSGASRSEKHGVQWRENLRRTR